MHERLKCDLLIKARRLAKKKGLDLKAIFCPPDKQAICIETKCPIGKLGYEASETPETPPANQVENFYQRAEKSLAEMKKHH